MNNPNSKDHYYEGGLYAVENSDGTFGVIKILKVDQEGVHIRIYSRRYHKFPADFDPGDLYLAGMNCGFNELLGIGHLPLSKKAFSQWGAKFLKIVEVEEDELDGYQIWLDDKGGYF